MKILDTFAVAGVAGLIVLTGCGKSEPKAEAKPVVQAEPATAVPMPAAAKAEPVTPPVADRMATAPAPALTAAPAPALAASTVPADTAPTVAPASTVPDYQAASVSQLAGASVQALTTLSQTVASSSPETAAQVDAVKTAVAGNQATTALQKLAGLGASVRNIPGGEAALATTKSLVSAWALKQGFDTAKISGLLGALQKGDYAAMGTQAMALMGKGNVTGEQKNVLTGVLNNYGIDATQAANAMNAVKGLFGK